jgi:DNA-binding beta-propeller fold protein YncE
LTQLKPTPKPYQPTVAALNKKGDMIYCGNAKGLIVVVAHETLQVVQTIKACFLLVV